MRLFGSVLSLASNWLRIPIRGYENRLIGSDRATALVTNPYKGL